jgi:inorganic pyrophosphatase
MPNFINLPPFTKDGDVHVVVETPAGAEPNLHGRICEI